MNDYLAKCKEELNTYLASALADETRARQLYEAMNYSLLADGKRLRPALCMATAETLGISRTRVLPAAAALEMVHCYSLIHDDLPCMDDDDLRRGVPTNHKVFGEALALLAGDGLLTEAFGQLARPILGVSAANQLRMVRVLSERAGASGMVGGQAVDMEMTGRTGTLDDVRFIHTKKTASLIQASIEIGALFADVPEALFEALSHYGQALGLAFQMIDDVLDVTGTQEELGKTPGKDSASDKLTYPFFVGIEETRRLALQEMTVAQGRLSEAGLKEAPLLFELQALALDRNH